MCSRMYRTPYSSSRCRSRSSGSMTVQRSWSNSMWRSSNGSTPRPIEPRPMMTIGPLTRPSTSVLVTPTPFVGTDGSAVERVDATASAPARTQDRVEQFRRRRDDRRPACGMIQNAELAAEHLGRYAAGLLHDHQRGEIVPDAVTTVDHVAPRVGDTAGDRT